MGDFGVLAAGRYLVTDQNAAELAVLAPRGSFRINHWEQPGGSDLSVVTLVRSGAWGDLMFLTPVLAKMKAARPGLRIRMACFPKHFSLFHNSGLVDELYPYPLNLAEDHPTIIPLESVVEDAIDTHATTAFAAALGVSLPDTPGAMRPIYKPTTAEVLDAHAAHPRSGRPRVGIGMFASVANRNYPLNQWIEVFRTLTERGWEVFVFGSPGQLFKMTETPTFKKIDTPFRQAAGVLATCDCFAGVDSAWLHMAGALDIPAVGLFGPVQWQVRLWPGCKTEALTGAGDCAPCHWYMHAGRQFPPHAACSQFRQCSVLADINPKRIVAKVDALRPSTP